MSRNDIYNISYEKFQELDNERRYKLLFGEINKETKLKFRDYLSKKVPLFSVFERTAIIAKDKGKERISATTIMRYLRSRASLFESNYEDYSLSDVYTNLIVRFFLWKNPKCFGLFELRRLSKEQRKSPEKKIIVTPVDDEEYPEDYVYNDRVGINKYGRISDLY